MCVSIKPSCATLSLYDPSPSQRAWDWGQSRGRAADRIHKLSREAGGGEAELAAGMPLSGAATRGGFKVSCTCHRPASRTHCPPLSGSDLSLESWRFFLSMTFLIKLAFVFTVLLSALTKYLTRSHWRDNIYYGTWFHSWEAIETGI